MKLNQKSLEQLRKLINEDIEYKSGPQLVEFFNSFGINDSYGQGFPSRWIYTRDKLNELNGTSRLEEVIKSLFNPINFINKENELETIIENFNKYIAFDNYRIIKCGNEIIVNNDLLCDTVKEDEKSTMEKSDSILILDNLIRSAENIKNHNISDPDFKNWRFNCERKLAAIYGQHAMEFTEFAHITYQTPSGYFGFGDELTNETKAFEDDFYRAIELLKTYKNDFIQSRNDRVSTSTNTNMKIRKIFISHSSKDKEIVQEFYDLLNSFVNPNQIFCSSIPGRDIEIGTNFYDFLKNQLSDDVLVIFLLSENFYKSPVCMCEMGATWVKSNTPIPIIIPPFSFEQMEGPLKNIQGLKITDKYQLTAMKDKICRLFELSNIDGVTWEQKRDRFIEKINDIISIEGF